MRIDEIGVESLSRLVAKTGATRAKLIKASDVAVKEWVRLKYQYGCDDYGQYLTCPSYSPTPSQTQKILEEYDKAILLEFKQDRDGERSPVHEIMAKLDREVFLSGYPASIGLASEPSPSARDATSRCVNIQNWHAPPWKPVESMSTPQPERPDSR